MATFRRKRYKKYKSRTKSRRNYTNKRRGKKTLRGGGEVEVNKVKELGRSILDYMIPLTKNIVDLLYSKIPSGTVVHKDTDYYNTIISSKVTPMASNLSLYITYVKENMVTLFTANNATINKYISDFEKNVEGYNETITNIRILFGDQDTDYNIIKTIEEVSAYISEIQKLMYNIGMYINNETPTDNNINEFDITKLHDNSINLETMYEEKKVKKGMLRSLFWLGSK